MIRDADASASKPSRYSFPRPPDLDPDSEPFASFSGLPVRNRSARSSTRTHPGFALQSVRALEDSPGANPPGTGYPGELTASLPPNPKLGTEQGGRPCGDFGVPASPAVKFDPEAEYAGATRPTPTRAGSGPEENSPSPTEPPRASGIQGSYVDAAATLETPEERALVSPRALVTGTVLAGKGASRGYALGEAYSEYAVPYPAPIDPLGPCEA